MIKKIIITFLILVFSSCDYFKKPQEPKAIARVGDSYLYREAIENLVPSGTTKKDSIAIVKTFIDNWATQKLLIKAAELNLGEEKLENLNTLVKQYKTDLLTKAYLEELVIRKIDTTVSNSEIEKYYESNKQFFKNSSELVKLRYINLVKDNPKAALIRQKFTSFTKKDIAELENLSIKFKSYAFNDSIWVDINQVFEKLPFINLDNKNNYIFENNNFQYSDSINLWFVKVSKVIPKDNYTPLQFLRPTIKNVILNNRKLQLLKAIEKEITDDAIKEKKYEIYE